MGVMIRFCSLLQESKSFGRICVGGLVFREELSVQADCITKGRADDAAVDLVDLGGYDERMMGCLHTDENVSRKRTMGAMGLPLEDTYGSHTSCEAQGRRAEGVVRLMWLCAPLSERSYQHWNVVSL